jgi:hypothetical protein
VIEYGGAVGCLSGLDELDAAAAREIPAIDRRKRLFSGSLRKSVASNSSRSNWEAAPRDHADANEADWATHVLSLVPRGLS